MYRDDIGACRAEREPFSLPSSGSWSWEAMRSPILLASLLMLAACATISPEAKVREKLLEAGLKPRMAQCVAERLVHHLSTVQLRKLGQLAKLPRQHADGHMRIDEFLARLDALGDPEIVAVATRAGLGCAIAG